jgi:hypothetical protein
MNTSTSFRAITVHWLKPQRLRPFEGAYFDNFVKMRTREASEHRPIVDRIRSTFDQKGDESGPISRCRSSNWDGTGDAVKEHAPDLIDERPVDSTVKDLANEAFAKTSESSEGE